MNKRVLVIGANGQLGKSVRNLATDYSEMDFTFAGRRDLDLSSSQSIDTYFQGKQFDVVINCAAYTSVDKAESEAELADQINHLAVKQLAETAKENEMTLIHISTDYVFTGQSYRPYIETDLTDPKGVYGLTKLKGEQAYLQVNPNGCVIRTSWVYSEHGHNFVKTMLRLGAEKKTLGVIFDQVGAPTYARDLAKTILDMVAKPENDHALQSLKAVEKVFHYSNEGVCSWYDFTKAIFELTQTDCTVNPIETKDYPTPATRPHYSVMNKSKIKQLFEITIPYWRDSLKVCLKELKEKS